MNLIPTSVTSHPGARITFDIGEDTGLLTNPEILIFFPGKEPENATITENGLSFTWVVPPDPGLHEVSVELKSDEKTEWEGIQVTINPAQAPVFDISTSLLLSPTPPVFADFYDPIGNLKASQQMVLTGKNYSTSLRPDADWLAGIYSVFIRDQNGLQDKISLNLHRPEFASMQTFYSLPNWQRQLIEYLKYEMIGDDGVLHPDAYYTLEQYANHWVQVVEEINNFPPTTRYAAAAIPTFWSNVMVKGTFCRVCHSLANRSVTVPRWSGLSVPIQDESHLQSSWEQRYNMLHPEYVDDRAHMKINNHLPGPRITRDPWLTGAGGSLSGTIGLAVISRPTWFSRGGI